MKSHNKMKVIFVRTCIFLTILCLFFLGLFSIRYLQDNLLYYKYDSYYNVEIIIVSADYQPLDIIPKHTTPCTLYIRKGKVIKKTLYKEEFVFPSNKGSFSEKIVNYDVVDGWLTIYIVTKYNGIGYDKIFPMIYVEG